MFQLDVDAVIAAHQAWFRGFQVAIDGINGEALLDMSAADLNQCVLGTWLATHPEEGAKHPELFDSIREVHADFHRLADEIIAQLEQGDATGAHFLLEKKLRHVSSALLLLLEAFRQCYAPLTNPADGGLA